MTDVRGTVADGFEPVREAFVRNFEQRGERGAAVAVYRDGHKVVDLWAGTRDVDGGPGPAGAGDASGSEAGTPPGAPPGSPSASPSGSPPGAPWAVDTAQIVRSVTKGVAAAVVLLLHQRGRIDLDAPVGTYWPEFKAAGKERVLVRHLLSHRAGLPALDRPLTPTEAIDGVSGPAALAAQAPAWQPGTDHGYHAQTYGWLLAELVPRVTGRSIGRWVAEEIARPLGLDFWLGLPAEEAHRVGRIGPVEEPPPVRSGGLTLRPKRSVADAYRDPDSLTRRAFGVIAPLPDENAPEYRAAELPASGGISTARALARFYASTIGAVDGGPRLFAPATLTLARTEESAGPDRVLVVPTRYGLGFMLHGPAAPLLGPGSFGHPGRGGSLGFADPDAGIAFGYVTNGLRKGVTADPRAQALVRAVRSAL
ncbi:MULTISPECIES: serine hydrolase domain-containing protein [Streptomyces]|uniref:Esterase n=1 Tax=Streptomyces tsukubensis (strain DSM 42081 / NBRC 108919 / NRRL 18488 / 9993) TaxID=1114943 RepID=I2MZS5_STRT9|nr:MULTISPECIES: serine hydrolase domain-containing protein [Streptomyces]AZK94516.1 esterase [Streptomyces tsukubensis]EIF90272.1 esterase [Streptomyces tsukubensis NRRL18488]MYS66208.1 serine hydrolase [Streptomyces sp. SID5473]QKM69393.1 esterase [Streptomyces tsukubensis NRRL18488]TAI42675.1 class A beta-lactamase-related serine hydrolase [Streptomyces tsukubensis]